MTRKWYAVDVLAEYAASEAVESAFNELGALGTEIDGLRKKQDEPLMVTGFFDEPPDLPDVRSVVLESLWIYGFAENALKNISDRIVPESDWLAEWKRHWKPTTVGKFVIAPPWSDVEASEKIVIRVEPNMAFGTGTHETTQLCLQAISERYDPSQSVLDIGTGTGILAIATAKLGGTIILACDTDADSVKIARENAALNSVAGQITLADGPIDDDTPRFDFVCANLTLDVISPMLPLLIGKAKECLVLSGILVTQETEILDQLTSLGIRNAEIRHSGEWLSVTIALS